MKSLNYELIVANLIDQSEKKLCKKFYREKGKEIYKNNF